MSRVKDFFDQTGGYSLLSTVALIAGLSIVFLLTACNPIVIGTANSADSGVSVTRNIKIPEFNSLVLNCPGTLHLSQGKEHSLTISADENIIDYFKAKVEGGVLTLDMKSGSYFTTLPIEFNLVVTDLESLTLMGSGRVLGKGILQTDNLSLRIKGSGDASLQAKAKSVSVYTGGAGDANLELTADELEVVSSGSGRVRLAGQVKSQSVDIKGSAEYLASELISDTAQVKLVGSGDIRLNVRQKLSVQAVGSGNVLYMGNPEISQSFTGSGQLRKLR